jgi:hypothetical protein
MYMKQTIQSGAAIQSGTPLATQENAIKQQRYSECV